MKGIKQIFIWSKKYIPVFILILALSILLQWLFSYLPLFVQYSFKILGYGDSEVALPRFLLNWFESIEGGTLKIILMVSITMVLLQAIRSVLRFIDNYFQGALAQYIGHDMRIKMYKHICDLPFSYHNNADIGDLIQRSTSDIDQISQFMSANLPNFIGIFVTVGIGAYQVGRISPVLMWVSLIIVPITAISSVIYFRYCNKAFDQIEQKESEMTTVIQENVNGARVVRAFSNELYEFEKMDKVNIEYSKRNADFMKKMALFWGISDGTVFLQYALTLSTGIILAQRGLLDGADIIAAMLLMGMLVWPMRGLGRMVAAFGKSSVAANRIKEILDMPTEFENDGTLTPKISGEIEFKNVSFRFKDDDRSLLDDISFKIKPGQTVALVGKTGSGKSTICNILARFLDYDSGNVLLDGVELKDINKKYLRTQIKYVLQDPFLFSKTVYENIAISRADISDKEVENAAKIAAIHNEVMKFDKGYKTIVGEKGTSLSGGQKQRVAIARMLVSDSPVIIFDDSLSALDTKTDVLIRKALKLKDDKQTMIIITHRTTTAKESDLILVLDKGKIADYGTHDELVSRDGLYKELWGIQGQLEEEFFNVLNSEVKA
ncbi:MAG: ABC transporter ATP-binding protein [Acholeplasmatales bacterium]|nr:ABC transporter ATP-binding protein [Acholeplasmatales bacterium]